MSIPTNKEALQESIDSWQESANHDKKQALLSFMIAAVGVIPAAVGAEALFSGDVIGGLVGIAVGGAFIAGGTYEGLQELGDYTDCVSTVAIRQYELDQSV